MLQSKNFYFLILVIVSLNLNKFILQIKGPAFFKSGASWSAANNLDDATSASSSLGDPKTDLIAWWAGGNVGGQGVLGHAWIAALCSPSAVSIQEVMEEKSRAGFVSTIKI